MNLKEAAGKLGISEGTARRWAKQGRLEHSKVMGLYGEEIFISEEAVESAKASTRTPVVIQSHEPAVPLAEMQRMVEAAMKRSMGVIVRDAVEESNQSMMESVQETIQETMASSGRATHEEIESLKDELKAIRELLEKQQKRIPLKERVKTLFTKKGRDADG